MSDLLKDLLGHQAWADAMFFHAWGVSGAREDEEIRSRTAHLVQVQEAFLRLLKGAEVGLPDSPAPPLDELLARCKAGHQVFLAMGRALDQNALERVIRVPWFPDPPCLVSVSEALTQTCLHSQHHRAQNMLRLKALGAKPRNVDYIIWLWKQKPEGRWDK